MANATGHNRWGRYETISGELHKLCNGPLHKDGGEFMPLHSFWIMNKGPRKGKPLSQCIACLRAYKGRDLESGLVPVDRVWFIFKELESRIGKTETCRRLGVSPNLWYRIEKRVYRRMYRKTAKAAMLLLRELRSTNLVRHKDSIKHGAAARGRLEKVPTTRRAFNGPDHEAAESRRRHSRNNVEQERVAWREQNKRRRDRKRERAA